MTPAELREIGENLPPIVSYQEAVALGRKRYFTGVSCKNGHLFERLVSSRACLKCARNAIKAWEEKNPEWKRKKSLKRRLRRPWVCFYAARLRAEKKGLPFDLDNEWAAQTWTGKCAITGIPFATFGSKVVSPFSPTVDRIVPELGYTKGNCRFVLHAINNMKGIGTDEQMVYIARKIVEVYDSRGT